MAIIMIDYFQKFEGDRKQNIDHNIIKKDFNNKTT